MFGQTAETIFFRGAMSPANEVPAIDINASGNATIRAHVVRNAAGEVISGTVDFIVNYTFPDAQEFTGLHIHRGAAGVNGGVVINTGIGGTGGNVVDSVGRGTINRPAQIPASAAGAAPSAALLALRDMIANPADFYVNLHTTVHTGGVIRAQLQKAEAVSYLTLLSPLNEVPPITTSTASGICAITALRTFGADGKLNGAQVLFEADYDMTKQINLTGFHIHNGRAGVNAGVVVNTGLANFPTPENGRGSLIFPVEVNVTTEANQNVINGLFSDPSGFYANIHTTEFTGGVIRGQLRRTDDMQFKVNMLTGNEVPPLTLDASAPAIITVNSIRNDAGEVEAARVIFDVNYRFPGETRFTGLHIHNQVAGQNGPVIINTGLSATNTVDTTTGFGNIYIPVLVSAAPGLATVNSMIKSPEQHYVNLHTTVNGGGAVRAQVGTQFTSAPQITEVGSSADPALKTLAPGSWMAVYGLRFAHVRSDYNALGGAQLPNSLNGVEVTVAGRPAPIFATAGGWADVQIPFETAAGTHPVVVKNAVGTSNSLNVTVQNTAPAIWRMGDNGGQIVRFTDFSFVDDASPGRAGDILIAVTTGLGQTTPALQTGRAVNDLPEVFGVTGVTASIGTVSAPVVVAAAYPGLPGSYIVAFMVPPNAGTGERPFTISQGGRTSNTVMLPLQ
jgi:uncharacterized protein (TIGR03437 family)